jgi:hypothetical protein
MYGEFLTRRKKTLKNDTVHYNNASPCIRKINRYHCNMYFFSRIPPQVDYQLCEEQIVMAQARQICASVMSLSWLEMISAVFRVAGQFLQLPQNLIPNAIFQPKQKSRIVNG